jgi:hypothetical protein
VLPCVDPVEYIANMSFALGFVSSDTILAIVIGLLGAFLLHVASKLLEVSVPFAVSTKVVEHGRCRNTILMLYSFRFSER